jgi:hypothetical protein
VRAGDTERRGPSREAGVAGAGVRTLALSRRPGARRSKKR